MCAAIAQSGSLIARPVRCFDIIRHVDRINLARSFSLSPVIARYRPTPASDLLHSLGFGLS
jgi:hypothetical protein